MSEFVLYLSEVFERFGSIQSRRMFGGHGIYHDGLMFALVASDELYLKTDGASTHFFEEAGSQQFTYTKNDKTMAMCYYVAPEEIFDDSELAKLWADRAYAAALRAKQPKSKSKSKR